MGRPAISITPDLDDEDGLTVQLDFQMVDANSALDALQSILECHFDFGTIEGSVLFSVKDGREEQHFSVQQCAGIGSSVRITSR